MAESSRDKLARVLTGYPKAALSYFDGAFAEASKCAVEIHPLVVHRLIETFNRGKRTISGPDLKDIDSLTSGDAEAVAAVYSLVAGLMIETKSTPSDFVEVGQGLLFLPAQVPIVTDIARAIFENRAEVEKAIERAQTFGTYLPSLTTFEVATDVRFRVAGGEVSFGVPVAIIKIDTDREGTELAIQLTKPDVRSLIDKLTACENDLAALEKFAADKNG